MLPKSAVFALITALVLTTGCKSEGTVNAETPTVSSAAAAPANHFELRGFTTGMSHDQVIAKAKENGMEVYLDKPDMIGVSEPGATTGATGGDIAVHPGMVLEIRMSRLTGRSMMVTGGMAGDRGSSIFDSAVKKWGKPTWDDGQNVWGDGNGVHAVFISDPSGRSTSRIRIVDQPAVNAQSAKDQPPASTPRL